MTSSTADDSLCAHEQQTFAFVRFAYSRGPMPIGMCPGCGAALAADATCAACGGEAVAPARAAAMRAALGGALVRAEGMTRRCAFCDGAMSRERAVVIVVDVCTACDAWFLDAGERMKLGNIAEVREKAAAQPQRAPSRRVVQKQESKLVRGLRVAAVCFALLLVTIGAGISVWAFYHRPPAKSCTSSCDCGAGRICSGGFCDRRECKTGLLSSGGCPANTRCVKDAALARRQDRGDTRSNGYCLSTVACPRSPSP